MKLTIRIWHAIMGYLTGTLYRHHKGGVYRLIDTVQESTNDRNAVVSVVYVSLKCGAFHVREREEWAEDVLWPDRVHRSRFEPYKHAPGRELWNDQDTQIKHAVLVAVQKEREHIVARLSIATKSNCPDLDTMIGMIAHRHQSITNQKDPA